MSSMTIVERRRELRRIAEYTEDALNGRGRPVCLQAAAGLGKTALLRAAQSAASAAGLASAAGTCWRERSVPYEPWLDILSQLHVVTGTTGWPYHPGLAGFVEVERALAAVADERPLLIGIDDLHCGDEGTLLLTRYLAGRAEKSGLVLLAAVRDLNPAGLLAETLKPFDRIQLGPLTEQAVAELCTQRGYRSLSGAAVSTLTSATGGVPLQVIVALESTRLDAVEVNLGADLPAMITARMGEQLAYATTPAAGTADTLLDDQARHALRERMTELADRIARARDDGDLASQEAAENELDTLSSYLRQSSGLAGRPRVFPSDTERARTSVRKAIVRAIDDIQRSNATIASHLKDHVVTGTTCCYRLLG